MSILHRSIAALGDVCDPNCWSGIPYHFWRAAAAAEFATVPCRVDLAWAVWPRRGWNLGRLLRGCGTGGFQYSRNFLDRVERQVLPTILAGEIISFNPHFPRASTVRAAGGRISYYIDATFAALSSGRGLDLRLPPDVVKEARELERENYQRADRVVAMARWGAESVVADCAVPPEKVFTILPGANLDLATGWRPPARLGRAGIDRDFVLGFVGKDWRRKGLPLICAVRDVLAQRGWKASVRIAGIAPRELAYRPGVEFAGFLDKRNGSPRFADFLVGCDVGCLFSDHEALGISTLEFLRLGVPVAGFAMEGPADTLPPDGGFPFSPGSSAQAIAEQFDVYLRDENLQQQTALAARRYAGQVTWQRCVREFQTLWNNGRLEDRFQLITAPA